MLKSSCHVNLKSSLHIQWKKEKYPAWNFRELMKIIYTIIYCATGDDKWQSMWSQHMEICMNQTPTTFHCEYWSTLSDEESHSRLQYIYIPLSIRTCPLLRNVQDIVFCQISESETFQYHNLELQFSYVEMGKNVPAAHCSLDKCPFFQQDVHTPITKNKLENGLLCVFPAVASRQEVFNATSKLAALKLLSFTANYINCFLLLSDQTVWYTTWQTVPFVVCSKNSTRHLHGQQNSTT